MKSLRHERFWIWLDTQPRKTKLGKFAEKMFRIVHAYVINPLTRQTFSLGEDYREYFRVCVKHQTFLQQLSKALKHRKRRSLLCHCPMCTQALVDLLREYTELEVSSGNEHLDASQQWQSYADRRERMKSSISGATESNSGTFSRRPGLLARLGLHRRNGA